MSDGGGGISVAGNSSTATLTIENSVVWNNMSPIGNDLRCAPLSLVYAIHCDLGSIHGTFDGSNSVISVDPRFANAEAGDLHLLSDSPCIDAGDPAYSGTAHDMDEEPRPFGAAIDIGADEFTDTDADHMADYWELAHFGELTNSDGTVDRDADALDEFAEYMSQTDPHDADSDSDLAHDGWEVVNGYDPLVRDMDGDGMWDGWEAIHGLNAFTNTDALLDLDGDRMDNLAEFTADTDPTNAASVLRTLWVGEQLGGMRIDWQGGVDSWQFLEASTNLMDVNGWQTVVTFPPPRPVTNGVVLFGGEKGNLFYRIRVQRR